nr:cytochrome c oxidase subunit 3 [Tettigometridae sp.]
MKKNHPFHMVTKSPWPIITSTNIMITMQGMVLWMYKKEMSLTMILIGMTLMLSCVMLWWRDIVRESTFQGNHTKKVKKGLKLGMIMFIISELMFFMSFFWTLFHSSLSPNTEIGMNWPPKSIETFNPMEIPLLNTIILLYSGVTITIVHNLIMLNKNKKSLKFMMLTIFLGMLFTFLQYWEYKQSSFTISDSIYGSIFFLTTGFHGMHVIIGSTFILVNFFRLKNSQFSKTNHLGFEMSAWYWHFVDVIWLFLYISIYWWSQ